MQIRTLATVGRISNLPTIWTNILAATVIAGAGSTSFLITPEEITRIAIVTLALSFMYIGGMFMNDAVDSEWDRSNNNPRPIVKGEITSQTVWIISIILLISATSLLFSLGDANTSTASAILLLLIVAYNLTHKRIAAAAFIMGFTRFGIYIICALSLAQLDIGILLFATGLLLYITGITYLARQEHQNRNKTVWPALLLCSPVFSSLSSGYDIVLYWVILLLFSIWVMTQLRTNLFGEKTNVRAGIGSLLAAIPLVDALYLASVNAVLPCIISLCVFLLVPYLHRYVSGT